MKDLCQYGNRREDEWEILPWIPDPRPPFKIWVKPEQIAPFFLIPHHPYTNKMIDMFAAGHTVLVELLCENRFMKTIVDDYGETVPTYPYDSEHFVAQIEVNPSGTFYGWVFKFMGGVKITAPQKCVEEMARIARTFL